MNAAALQIILPSGDSDGVVFVEMHDWSGKVLILPRGDVPGFINDIELSGPGVYILMGENQEDFSRDYVYVGESESVPTRLKQHLSDKGKTFWKRVVIMKSKTGSLNKAHVKYIESRLLNDLKQAEAVVVTNHNKNITENHLTLHDKMVADDYIRRLKNIMRLLGINFFNKRSLFGLGGEEAKAPTVLDYSNPIFEIKTVGVRAFGRMVGDKFVVAKGSTLRNLQEGTYAGHIKQMVESDVIEHVEEAFYSFKRDVAFTSVSLAASVIAGTQRSGYAAWKILSTTVTMRQWVESMEEVFGFDFNYSQMGAAPNYPGESIRFEEL